MAMPISMPMSMCSRLQTGRALCLETRQAGDSQTDLLQAHFPVFRQSLDRHIQYLCTCVINWDVYILGSTLSPLSVLLLVK